MVTAVTAGRNIDMANVLAHELSPSPLSLAKAGGEMNGTNKSELLSLVMSGVEVTTEVPDGDLLSCVLIDGHALIQALAKPHGCITFGDYADAFVCIVTQYFNDHTTRIDVVFDRYVGPESKKAGTRLKRVGKVMPIRRIIDGRHIPLPNVWSQYISSDVNKADLALFCQKQL